MINGVQFSSDYHTVTVTVANDGNYQIKTKDSSAAKYHWLVGIERYVYKIPILRGIYQLSKTGYIFVALMIVALMPFLITNIGRYLPQTSGGVTTYSMLNKLLYIVLAGLFVKILWDLVRKLKNMVLQSKILFSYHGAEHMAAESGELRPVPDLQIIELDDWYTITTEMKRRAEEIGFKSPSSIGPSAKGMYGVSLLTGFLKCGYCGKSMINSGTYNSRVTRRGKDYYYLRRDYLCITRDRKGKQSCPDSQSSYSQKKVDSIVIAELEHFLSNLDLIGLEAMVDSSHWTEMAQFQTKIKVLEKDLKKYEQVYKEWGIRLDAHFADKSSSLYSEDYIAAKIREYSDLITTCKVGLDEARKQIALSKTSRSALQDFVTLAPQWFSTITQDCY